MTLTICLAAAALTAGEILETVNGRLTREFIGQDGLVLDYVGPIPTPEEIVELKPNAMGWWTPIENGSMFTGEWLPALMQQGIPARPTVVRCVRGLLKMSEVSDVPGVIARGTGTDGRSHYPCGSNDQTDPWFFGLCEFCRWPHAFPELKAEVKKRLVEVATALEKNDWGVPCDGAFKGENRGNLNSKAMPFWGKTRLLYTLKSLEWLTHDDRWGRRYDEIKASALAEIEAGGAVDEKVFPACYKHGLWIYVSSAEALARLIEMEEEPADRARMKAGFLKFAERCAPLMKDRAKYANTTERPFKYANWREGYDWRPQKTQKEAEAVAGAAKREVLGMRKDYERNGMANPLAAAAVCALQGDPKFRDEILATLRHYDYSTPNVSEFFHAAIAAAALERAASAVSHRIGEVLPGTEDAGLFPFTFDVVEPGSVADMSGYLDAPAGKHGFVRAVGEKFFVGDREIFLNGVNLTGPACVPEHDEADRLAARLAGLGINCVRLHFADCTGYSNFRMDAKVKKGLLAEDWRSGMTFDAANLERYDYLVAALKKRGIYVDINLRVGLTLDGRDGFPNGPSLNRGVCAIDPRLVEFEKKYAKMLLTHVNPHTGLTYAQDPAVAIVEIRNESALLGHWFGGLVDDLAEPWATQFKMRWNEWLERKYGDERAIAAAWGAEWAKPIGQNEVLRGRGDSEKVKVKSEKVGKPVSPPVAVSNDFIRFVADLDTAYWRTMAEYLKRDLGVKCVVVGTTGDIATPYMQDDGFFDAYDTHFYWSHPDLIGKTDGGWKCVQTAEVNFPEDGMHKGTCRPAGLPFMMTETSEPFPSLYASEHAPLVHAYGAFQGWAGLFHYTWSYDSERAPTHSEYFFSHAGRPDTQAHFPACAAISLGKAVRESSNRITVPAPEAEYFQRLVAKRRVVLLANEALPEGEAPFWNETIRHGIAVDLTGKVPKPTIAPQPADRRWRTDTGELLWDVSVLSNGFVTLDAPNVKFFTGFIHGRTFGFKGLKLSFGRLRFDFATVTLVSKDGTGFGEKGPARILVAATGIAKNSGQVFEVVEPLKGAWHDPDGLWTASYGDKWGRAPQLVEGVPATLTLDVNPNRISCWALDPRGRRKAALPVSPTSAGAEVRLDPRCETVWYELEIR